MRRETADSVSVQFEVPAELREKFRFRPGQHLTLKREINGEELRRNYSVCVAPHDDELRIAIKQIARGAFSTWANRELQAGHVIEVMPPHGSFTWRFERGRRRRYAAFAGGSGITPILSLIKTGLAEEPESTFTLFYGNRTSHTIMFLEELCGLKDRYLERLQVFHFLEEEEEEIALFNGRLDRDKVGEVLDCLLDASRVDAFFICGPGPMMTAIEEALKTHAVASERILIERFTVDGAAAPGPDAQPLAQAAQGRSVQLTLDGRKRTITFDASKGSILENARASGLPAPYACKAGVCATCRAKVVSGEVRMKVNYGLSPEELAQGYVLTCQAVPVSDKVVLDYDS